MTACEFCDIVAGRRAAHLVLADQLTVAFLDARPVFKGHVLVVPRAHYQTLGDLPVGLIQPLFAGVRRISVALPGALGAQGSFVGLNNTVSQSVPHLHVHVVPRTKGDGLRGFFWPRTRYASDEEAADYANKIKNQLAAAARDDEAAPQPGSGPPSADSEIELPASGLSFSPWPNGGRLRSSIRGSRPHCGGRTPIARP